MSDQPPISTAIDDEFFIGYLPKAPAGIARRVRFGVAAALVAGVVGALAMAAAFHRPAAATWSDQLAAFEGELISDPYPTLRVPDTSGKVHRYLLVATGKHGAQERLKPRGGGTATPIKLWGTVLERDGRKLIEIADEPGGGELEVIGDSDARVPTPDLKRLGRATISGEVIDPKCFFGAMKPGEGKLHKACAIRCIDGGIPPMLAERNAAGQITYYLLVVAGESGTRPSQGPGGLGMPANRRVLPFIAEPVAVTGEVVEIDGLRVLSLDNTPEAIVRR